MPLKRKLKRKLTRKIRTWFARPCAGVLVAAAAGTALAQTGTPIRGAQPPGLTPVDPGWADVSPFGLSFRRMDLDFRRPIGFERVYQLAPGQAGMVRPPWTHAGMPSASPTPRFARASGALTAVFPRSSYVPTKDGRVAAEVPPDTRFVIGTLPSVTPAVSPSEGAGAGRLTVADHVAASGAVSSADRRVDRTVTRARSANPAGDEFAPASSQESTRPPEGMLTSESYRVRRIAGLLNEAVQAGSERAAE